MRFQSKNFTLIKAQAFEHAIAIQQAVIENRNAGFGGRHDLLIYPAQGLVVHFTLQWVNITYLLVWAVPVYNVNIIDLLFPFDHE